MGSDGGARMSNLSAMPNHRPNPAGFRWPILGGAFRRNRQRTAARIVGNAAPLTGHKPRLPHVLPSVPATGSGKSHRTLCRRSGYKCAGLSLWACEPQQERPDTHASTRQFPFSLPFSSPLATAPVKAKHRCIASCIRGHLSTLRDPLGTGVGRRAHHLQSGETA